MCIRLDIVTAYWMVNKDLHISQTQTYGSSGSNDSFSVNDGIGPSDAVTMCRSLRRLQNRWGTLIDELIVRNDEVCFGSAHINSSECIAGSSADAAKPARRV